MRQSYRNVSFLAELMINILVFSISCAILAGLFGKAGMMARETKEKGFASAEVYSLLQTLRVRDVEELGAGEILENGSVICFYDNKWNTTTSSDAYYEVVLNIDTSKTDAGELRNVTAVARHRTNERKIFELKTTIYKPEERGGAG